MQVDYHVHGLAHGEFKHTLANLEPFVKTAVDRGISELGFTEHDWLLGEVDFNLYEQLQRIYPQVKIRIGLEVDYRAGREEEMRKIISSFPFDYTIGSVHEINDWMFDHPDYLKEYDQRDSNQLYEDYFNLVQAMAKTKLCQVVGHLDLIKVFGVRSAKKVTDFLPPVLTAIKEAGMAVEINTNGWYKPVKEVYPAKEILAECFRYGIPITLSSDAHHHDQVGRDLEKAVKLAKEIGYTKIATFVRQKMIMEQF